VDLINIGNSPPAVNVFKEIDADKDLALSREEVRVYGEAPPLQLCPDNENCIAVLRGRPAGQMPGALNIT
jgi:hypothetical protein